MAWHRSVCASVCLSRALWPDCRVHIEFDGRGKNKRKRRKKKGFRCRLSTPPETRGDQHSTTLATGREIGAPSVGLACYASYHLLQLISLDRSRWQLELGSSLEQAEARDIENRLASYDINSIVARIFLERKTPKPKFNSFYLTDAQEHNQSSVYNSIDHDARLAWWLTSVPKTTTLPGTLAVVGGYTAAAAVMVNSAHTAAVGAKACCV